MSRNNFLKQKQKKKVKALFKQKLQHSVKSYVLLFFKQMGILLETSVVYRIKTKWGAGKQILGLPRFTQIILMSDGVLAQHFLFWVVTQFQETQKIPDVAAMLVSQTKEIIKSLLLRVHQQGRHDVR